MNRSSARRSLRRIIASVAGTALVATGLGLGLAAPAQAADSVVSGNVTDTQGNGVAGTADFYRVQPDLTTVYEDSATSDFGHFEATVPDGTYKIEFTTSDSNISEWYLDKTSEATADPVTVGGGSTTLTNWTIEQSIVTGTVVGPNGNPVRYEDVEALDAATGFFVGSTTTDAKGNFALPVASGPVKLYFSGYFASEWYNDKPTFETADPVTGTASGAYIGVVTLGAGGAIYGYVTSDAGVPLEYAKVSAFGSGRTDLTDKNGFYAVDNLSPGKYKVYFSDPIGEYAPEYYDNATTNATATPVDVGVNQPVAVSATLTPLPAKPATSIEATGVVKDDLGVPIVGAVVDAYNTPGPTGGIQQVVESTRSNRAGVYVLDELDNVPGENQFKLFGSSDGQGDDDAFGLFGRWYGGQQSYDRANVLTTTPPTPVAADIVLARAGGVAGSITGAAGLPGDFYAILHGVDNEYAGGANVEADNTFETRYVPAGTYKVGFFDSSGFHAPEWWKDATFANATEITVKAGQLTGGLDAVLSPTLNAVERPEVPGYPWVGKPITVDRGMWNLETRTTYTYEWLVGSTVVGTGPTFTPSAALIGDRLVVRVSAENGQLVGSATSLATAKVGYKPTIKVKVKGDKAAIAIKASPVKAKKIKGKVVIKEIIKVKDDGTIKYKTIDKSKIKKGKGTASLAKLKAGKHKLVFFFTGKGKVGSNDVTVKVKTKN